MRLRVIDPDSEPAAARAAGLRSANTAVLEADGRRVQVETTDERQIAIGIQRLLRTDLQTVCFLEGHNELPIDNFEFHTHLESVSDHSHDDASSAVVMTSGHGIGRFRRALEAQGYEARKLTLATGPGLPPACKLLVLAGPRTTFLPAESLAITRFLEGGGALLALLDLGFAPDPELARLLDRFGLALPSQVVVDPLSHYATDAEMVAVTSYTAGAITRNLSMSFFPGVRPLIETTPAPGLVRTPLFSSSRDSYVRQVETIRADGARVTVRDRDRNAGRARSAPARRGDRGAADRRRTGCRFRHGAHAGDRRRRQRLRQQLLSALSREQRPGAGDDALAAARGTADDRADANSGSRP